MKILIFITPFNDYSVQLACRSTRRRAKSISSLRSFDILAPFGRASIVRVDIFLSGSTG